MAEEREHDPSTVDQPSGQPPDEGRAYDPSMTEGDEANIPPGSDSDPEPGPDARPSDFENRGR